MIAPASIGLIIPSSNRLTEPQFNAYAPPGVGIHVTRLRMTGKFRKPLSELKRPLVEAAEALSDVKPGMIVFHCTANSMESGLAHEKAIIEIIEQASGCPTITTAQAITQAFDRFGITDLVTEFVLSFQEGSVKPEEKIFRIACDRLGVPPHQALMIGDSVEADGGAAALGCQVEIVESLPTTERPDALLAALARHGL